MWSDVDLSIEPFNGYNNGYKVVENPHITLAYKPDDQKVEKIINENPRECEFEVIGYGLNQTNEAIEVSRPLNCDNKVPHITLSLREGGKAVDSNNLVFHSDKIGKICLISRKIPNKIIGRLTAVTTEGRILL